MLYFFLRIVGYEPRLLYASPTPEEICINIYTYRYRLYIDTYLHTQIHIIQPLSFLIIVGYEPRLCTRLSLYIYTYILDTDMDKYIDRLTAVNISTHTHQEILYFLLRIVGYEPRLFYASPTPAHIYIYICTCIYIYTDI